MRGLLSEHATMLARRRRRRRKGDPVQNVAGGSLEVKGGRRTCSYAYNRRHSSLRGEGLLSRSVNLSAGRRHWAQGGPRAERGWGQSRGAGWAQDLLICI